MICTITLIDFVRCACLREACTRVNLARLNCIKAKLRRPSADELERVTAQLLRQECRLLRISHDIKSHHGADAR